MGRHKQHNASGVAPQPWLTRKEWAHNPLRQHNRVEVWVAWGLAVFWNGLLLFAAGPAVPVMVQSRSLVALGVLSLLVACGLGLFVWALHATRHARRYGELRLFLDPYPGSIGGHFGATLPLNVAYRPDLHFQVVLECVSSAESTDMDGDKSVIHRCVWRTEGFAQVEPAGRGVELRFRFNVPDGLPASLRKGEFFYRWSLHVHSEVPGVPFNQSFHVPVFPTREASSSPLLADATQHPHMPQALQTRVDAVARMETIPGGVRLYQPYARSWRQAFQILVFGGGLAGAGAFVRGHDAPWFISAVFGAGAGAMLLWGCYSLGNSVSVRVDQRGVRTERRLLGCMLFWQQVPAAQIANIAVTNDLCVKVEAILTTGKRVTLSEDLPGLAEAERLLAAIARATGYRY